MRTASTNVSFEGPDGATARVRAPNGTLYVAARCDSRCSRALAGLREVRDSNASDGTDAERIAHAFLHRGAALVEDLPGAFSLAVLNEATGEVFAARDGAGKERWFFREDGETLRLSARSRDLRRAAGRELGFDPTGLRLYLELGYVPAPWTLWSGIRKLGPGESLTWSGRGTLRVRCWCRVPEASTDRSGLPEFRERFAAVLREEVDGDDDPTILLSSGLDSVGILGGLDWPARGARTVTMVAENVRGDEQEGARRAAQAAGVPHEVLSIRLPEPLVSDAGCLGVYDEPQAHDALILSLRLYERLREHGASTIVSGEGGETLFGGYGGAGPRGGDHDFLEQVLRRVPGVGARALDLLATRRSDPLQPDEFLARIPRIFSGAQASRLAGLEPSNGEGSDPVREALCSDWRDYSTPSQTARAVQTRTFVADSLVPKIQDAAEGAGVRVILPYVDVGLIGWSLEHLIPDRVGEGEREFLRAHIADRFGRNFAPPRGTKLGFIPRSPKLDQVSHLLDGVLSGPLTQAGISPDDLRAALDAQPGPRRAQIVTLSLLSIWLERDRSLR